MKENVLKLKTKSFAIRIINLYKFLTTEKKEFVLSKQLLRCGTSVGANIREAEYAESKVDFVHKMAIAQKEINESIYWIELLNETEFINQYQFDSMSSDATEIIKLITTLLKTAKSNIHH